MNISSGGKVPAVSASHVIALYEPSSGRIAHMHEVVVFEGGKAVTREHAEREARDVAQRQGHKVDKLHVLHTDRLPHAGMCRVDVDKKALVAVAHPGFTRRRR